MARSRQLLAALPPEGENFDVSITIATCWPSS